MITLIMKINTHQIQIDDSPKLFSEDSDVSFNDDVSDNYDELLKKPESDSTNVIDKDLSDLSFDDKDDLEIPAFLRRQTNQIIK